VTPGPPRMGVRRRLVLGLVASVAVTALAVGTVSVVLLERSLRSRLVEDSVATAEFDLTALVPAVGLPDDVDADTIRQTGLLERFLTRGTDGVWVELEDGSILSAGQVVPPELLSPELTDLVAGGELAYQFVDTPDGPYLVTGARLPPDGPSFFFVDAAGGIGDAVRRLALVAAIAGAGAVLVGAVVATGLARRLLRPVTVAGEAAERIAGGDLEVRLPAMGPDELGRLSRSFNEMAASLRATIDELTRARERERRFVADVSHELKTPLTGLVNEADMLAARLRANPSATDDERTIAGMLEQDVARLRRLVDDLLEISRLEADSLPVRVEDVDLVALLGAIRDGRHPEAALHADVDRPIPLDRHGLERIMGNLLDNARRHAAGAPVDVSASLVGATLTIEVADRGPGVDPGELPHLFDRFATADPSRSSGTGLGLAIVAEHARRMGGEAEAALRPGGGLVARVILPVGEPLHGGDLAANGPGDDDGEHDKGAAR
jgi:signal transduction histidine kinase